jgi:hypothetical protein
MKCRSAFLHAVWLGAAVLPACSYEPPKPGMHVDHGNPRADITCMYEAPTASNFVVKRCRRTADMDHEAEFARGTADAFKTPVPDVR